MFKYQIGQIVEHDGDNAKVIERIEGQSGPLYVIQGMDWLSEEVDEDELKATNVDQLVKGFVKMLASDITAEEIVLLVKDAKSLCMAAQATESFTSDHLDKMAEVEELVG